MKLKEEIAKVAYELYEKSGRIPGRERQNWLEAERIVLTRHASQELEEPEGEESMVADEVLVEEVEEKKPTYEGRKKEEYSAFAEEKKVQSTKVRIKKETAKKTEKAKASKPAAAKGKKLSPKKKTQKSAAKKSK